MSLLFTRIVQGCVDEVIHGLVYQNVWVIRTADRAAAAGHLGLVADAQVIVLLP